jgi:hypothetical protein
MLSYDQGEIVRREMGRKNADKGYSSVVLWVSQNMEDEYAYNLAL